MVLKWNPFKRERRKHKRYNTAGKVSFNVIFDFVTKINYQIIDLGQEKLLSQKYAGLSKDISAEGLCFISPQKLEKGDILRLEVYVPEQSKPVTMDGEVRWSGKISSRGLGFLKGREKGRGAYATGVKLLTIEKKPVSDSIYFDEKKQVAWSAVLESIMGQLLKKKKTS